MLLSVSDSLFTSSTLSYGFLAGNGGFGRKTLVIGSIKNAMRDRAEEPTAL